MGGGPPWRSPGPVDGRFPVSAMAGRCGRFWREVTRGPWKWLERKIIARPPGAVNEALRGPGRRADRSPESVVYFFLFPLPLPGEEVLPVGWACF
jgi:hypothetical protein